MTQDKRTSRARLDEIHDGDTVRMIMDTLFDSTHRESMRLKGDYAPELVKQEPFATLARDFVVAWFATHDGGTSWPYEVDTWRTSGDNDVMTLGRYVAVVRHVVTGACLNDDVAAFLALHPDWPKGIGA